MKLLLSLATLTCCLLFAGVASSRTRLAQPARSAAELYTKYCVSCHGLDGQSKTSKGKLSHARNISSAEWQEAVSDERIFNSIMNGRSGRGNMPAFSKKISDDEADSLVTYVRGLKK